MKRHSPAYIVGFAAALALVSAGLLTGMRELTAEAVAANQESERLRNVMTALGVPLPEGATNDEVIALAARSLKDETRGGVTGTAFIEDGRVRAIAFEFAGQGLWAPIRGYIALEPDLATVRRIAIYEQKETPGLGAEIMTDAFLKQFVGKPVVHEERPVRLEVDAVTGATMTSKRLETMLNEALERIREAWKR